ncbi:MAG: 50S ribosomal protein L29 [Candidatus Thiodiazotropha sp. (ex Epidulcina cf. delphinae)]|nr:50S ribosomal protein L29 [Candidatus Thiodiazotropha sp. (ex Epidulcina cf. delphinae)]
MKASELRAKSQQELTTALDELLKEQFNLRMQQGTGQMPRPSRVKEVRKDIARVKTLMNEQMLGNAS